MDKSINKGPWTDSCCSKTKPSEADPLNQSELSLSRHNIFGRIKGSTSYFIVNLLSRNADILSPEKAQEILRGRYAPAEEFRQKGYLVDPEEEDRRYRAAYLDFLDLREDSEIQIFYVPTYGCNFACTYCYQGEYKPEKKTGPVDKVIESLFAYLDRKFADRKKYLTIFGGEPLLPGKEARETLVRLIDGANARGLSIAVVTNGYHLSEYLDLLPKARIREIQVTLDGTERVHDQRRTLRVAGLRGYESSLDGTASQEMGTFHRIVRGIDRALAMKLPVNLRVVLDRENIDNLPGLAGFAERKGWTENPLFKTQLGRTYELHSCQADPDRLFSRISLYETLYDLIRRHPEILAFHRPSFSVAGFLFENGDLPDPLFDSCPGAKTEWAFDYTGKIYSCTAMVGRQGEALGSFYPEVTIDRERVEEWEERDVTSIPECASCPAQLACGGGCAAVARNRTGRLQSADCRPVKELLEMGISLYFDREAV